MKEKTIFNYFLLVLSLIVFVNFSNISFSQQTPIYNWINNDVIHYTSIRTPLIISNQSRLYVYPNGEYYYQIFSAYYNEQLQNETKKSGTEFNLAKTAYPFPFITNMINDKVPYCVENSIPVDNQSNLTQDFFFSLCNIAKENNSALNQINGSYNVTKSEIKELAQKFVANDNFTKQLYNLYYSYSNICQNSNSNIDFNNPVKTYCEGNIDNISIPNPISYSNFYQSLYDYVQMTENDNQIPYLELKYDINEQEIFPKIYNNYPIQLFSTIAGIYPAILPSGQKATYLANNSTVILPIKVVNNTEASILNKNGFNITSGVFGNVSLFAGVQEVNNSYAIYNISMNQTPFEGTEYAGDSTFFNSCNANQSTGLSKVETKEESEMAKSIYSGIFDDGFVPANYNSQYPINSLLQSSGSSIVQATMSNTSIGNTKIVYGVLNPENNTITYENTTTINVFSQATQILSLPIPKSAFTSKKMVVFLRAYSPVSYYMDYKEFDEYIQSPKYNITHYVYNETKLITVNYTKDNITYQKQVPETIECDVQQVSATMNYSAKKIPLANEYYNYNLYSNQTINVSTNLNITRILNKNQTNLNYSFTYYNVNKQTKNGIEPEEYTNITLPLMNSFELFSSNGTMLYSFDSYTFDSNLIKNNFVKNLTSISKDVYAYDPSYVYPNQYSSIPVLYPTLENAYSNSQYLFGIGEIEQNQPLSLTSISQSIEHNILLSISGLIKSNLTYDYAKAISISNSKQYGYLQDNCPDSKTGMFCFINQNFYTYGQNYTSKNEYQDFDLLNPTIYTQNVFELGKETPSNLCSVASGIIGQLFDCGNVNKNFSDVYIDTNHLDFNTSFGKLNNTEKEEFYKDLENSTTNTSEDNTFYDGYTFLHSPTYVSNFAKSANFTNNVYYNSNGTITIDFSRAFSGIQIDGCDYEICFNEYLKPTKGELNTQYQLIEKNNTAFYYIVPQTLFNDNASINQRIQLTANNKTENFTIGKIFIINYINKNYSNVFSENNITINASSIPFEYKTTSKKANKIKIPVINVEYPMGFMETLSVNPQVKITFYQNTIYIKPITYVFNKTLSILFFTSYKIKELEYIILFLIIIGILYYFGIFKEIEIRIKAKIEKFKTEYF